TCSDYFGFLSAYDKGNMNCGIVKHFPQIGYCYSDCGCDGYVDWGDGTAQDVSTSSVSHTYSEGGTYEIKLGASISRFALNTFTNAKPISLQQLNLATVTDMSSAFANRTTITGSIPELPPTITNAQSMFEGCSGLIGGFPSLPDSITNGYQMFYKCSGLEGNITKLPSNLSNGENMFLGTTLTVTILSLPSGLKKASGMFQGQRQLTGTIPSLPSTLTEANSMFRDCSNLTGVVSPMPSNLTSYPSIFGNTSVTNDGTWPEDAWQT
ncbi:MAG: BspA family leucine-rich repeat surface protein, partial [Alphaproteobacteria bacterium]|nr:BspA family leucine-rich repeat surface protein [Alphaproteobacteria bacterium]